MQTKWFSHLPKSEQEEFKKYILSSQKVLDRLKEICYNTINDGVKTSFEDYDSPSWSHKQADLNGYLRAHRELIELLTLDKR